MKRCAIAKSRYNSNCSFGINGLPVYRSPKFHIWRWRVSCSPAQRKIEFRRHDSDDEATVAIHLNVSSDDIAIGIEPADPEPITEDHFIAVLTLILLRENVAAEHRLYAERRKQVRGHIEAIEGLGRSGTIACQVENHIAVNS